LPSKALIGLAIACLVAAIALRVPAAPRYLCYEDSVNFAQAVEHFDPRHLVPQPPGYPLFILQSKILRTLTGGVERAFLAGVILATAVAFFALMLLTRAMAGAWPEAIAAAALLAINPVFLFTGFTSPSRVYLAAVSTVVALACWLAWTGNRRWAFVAAVLLGLGAGYRPELLALLIPLWAVSSWRAFRSARAFALGAALLTFTSALWIGYLLSCFPDLASFVETFRKYLGDQSRDLSPVFGASAAGWKRMLFRTAIWNGTAIAGWALLAPLARPSFRRSVAIFIALWIVPALIFHAVVHLDDPDQALSTIPAFCLVGGVFLVSFFRRNRDAALLGAAFVAAFNLAIFLAPFPLKPERPWYTPVVDAWWHTSYTRHASVAEQADALIPALAAELRRGRTLVLWNRAPLTWRTLSYYFPNQTLCLLLDDPSTGNRPHAALWRNLELQERIAGPTPVIPLADAEQLLWVLGPSSPVRVSIAYRLEPRAEGLYRSPAVPLDLPGYRIVR
jgi:hypothetical protein